MDIKPRTFGRSELAQCYFPKLKPMTAWEKLKLELTRRTFTPAEVQLIYSEFGEP